MDKRRPSGFRLCEHEFPWFLIYRSQASSTLPQLRGPFQLLAVFFISAYGTMGPLYPGVRFRFFVHIYSNQLDLSRSTSCFERAVLSPMPTYAKKQKSAMDSCYIRLYVYIVQHSLAARPD
jgi:hypothetical protein